MSFHVQRSDHCVETFGCMDSVAHAELNLCLTFGFLNSLINMVMILNSGYGLEDGGVSSHGKFNRDAVFQK